jgi:hypothetical protein
MDKETKSQMDGETQGQSAAGSQVSDSLPRALPTIFPNQSQGQSAAGSQVSDSLPGALPTIFPDQKMPHLTRVHLEDVQEPGWHLPLLLVL